MIERMIRGMVGQCAESHDPEHVGKWFFTIQVNFPESEQHEYGPFGPWRSESIAQTELERCLELFRNEFANQLLGDKRKNPKSKKRGKGKGGSGKRSVLDACDL